MLFHRYVVCNNTFDGGICYLCISTKEFMDKEIEQLKSQLSGDMFKDMEIKDQIHKLEMQSKGVSCSIEDEECLACGS